MRTLEPQLDPAAKPTETEERVFHSLATVADLPLLTADGERRAIRTFLLDDRSWLIQYLVVDVGKWFAPRLVVLAADRVDLPDWNAKIIRAHLTADELLACPDAETVKPVSRQQQLAWNRHFGWPDDSRHWSGPSSKDSPWREFQVTGPDDPHLRRSQDLISYQIWGTNGYLGLLEDFFLEDASWHIGYLLVRAGDWIYREKMVSTSNVVAISWGQHRVVLDCAIDAAQEQLSM